jgi:hypothetical protein
MESQKETKVAEEDRLSRIESQIQELAKQVSAISSLVSDLHLRNEESKLSMTAQKNVNPWTLQTASRLSSEIEREVAPLRQQTTITPSRQYTARIFETYRDTLNVLKSAEAGCTADEVSKKTGRNRNTESGYLYKLYLAGLLKREKRGKKIVYILEDKGLFNKVFGTT